VFVGLFVDIRFVSVAEDIKMGRVGFEHPPMTQSKTVISANGGVKSDAQRTPSSVKDPDLVLVVEY
jgi:hypothetical protein